MKTSTRYISMVAIFALMLGMASVASAACSTYLSNTIYGTTAGYSTDIVVSPFTVNCSPGAYTGTLTKLTGSAWLTLQLEKQISGVWTVVAFSGGWLWYSGTSGTYRYSIKANNGVTGSWKLAYKHPVF